MKKAILIVGIIWLILCLAGGIFELIYGISDFVKVSDGTSTLDPNPVLGVANIIVGCWLLIGADLCIIMIVKRNSNISKSAGIVIGVLGILFSAEVPGILFIIDSVQSRE